MTFSMVAPGIYRGSLPTRRELHEFAGRGGKAVVDLTQRKRETVERNCRDLGIEYHKHAMPYEGGDAGEAAALIASLAGPVLFHCFHGRDRAGRVADALLMMLGRGTGPLEVVLIRVGRNINRSVRTCASFGMRRVLTFQCAPLSGALYSASDTEVVEIDSLPESGLAIEVGRGAPLSGVSSHHTLIVGGEQSNLWSGRLPGWDFACIPCGKPCLTTEAALAIALYQFRC